MFGFGTLRAHARRGGSAPLRALRPLALSPATVTAGTPADGSVTGANDGSTLVATALPGGFALDGAARTWRYDGSGAARTAPFTLRETLAGAANSPRDTSVAVTVEAGGGQPAPVILAVLAGQSNMEGRATREAQDIDVAGAVQFVGDPSVAGYRTLSSDITPLWGPYSNVDSGGAGFLGPGEYIAHRLLADNAGAAVVLVPTFRGSTKLVAAPAQWASSATPGAGGELFENMVDQANRAYTAAQAAYPGRPIAVRFFWVQGEFDADVGITRAAYLAALQDLIARARARITGAAAAPFVIGSMVPERWHPTSPNRQAEYIAINAAHVDASFGTGVLYAKGPDYVGGAFDNLHYLAPQRVRDFGAALAAALSDAQGPAMTSPAAVGTTAGDRFALTLASDDAHSTFEIHGGADAARFEISDRYLAPMLRWTGDGTGPVAGNYAVNVRARDGSGNAGADQAVALTVASGSGSGPVTATWRGTATTAGTSNGGAYVHDVPLGVGLNLLFFSGSGGTGDVTGVGGPAGSVGTAFVVRGPGNGGCDGTLYGLVSTIEQTGTIGCSIGGGNNLIGDLTVAVVTLTGTKPAPIAGSAAIGGGNAPLSTPSVPCPIDGIVVAIGKTPGNGAAMAGSGVTPLGAAGPVAAGSRSTTGTLTINDGSGQYAFLTRLAFEKSGT